MLPHLRDGAAFHRAKGVLSSLFGQEHSLAFLDAFPATPGHSLLVPKKAGYATLDAMPADEAGAFLRDLPRLVRAVKAATGCDGVNVVQNNGAAAGQVVMHAHFHVIPRVAGDGLVKMGTHGGGHMLQKDEAAPILEKLRLAASL